MTRRRLARSALAFASLSLAAASFSARAREADAQTPPGPQLLHVPAAAKTAEQGILTPVPIALQLPAALPARRVLLHYLIFGAKDWRSLELQREGQRYVGAIPCLEVSTITGEIRYYMRAHDAAGAVVAFSGTRSSPYRVAVHHSSARADLAGSQLRCPDPADCPPGLAGCPSAEVERLPCERDADCEGGNTCGWDGFCGDDPRRRNWLGVELSQGLGVAPTRGACSVYSQENEGYACYRQGDGAVYTGRPVYSNEPLRAGLAPTRLLVSYERLLFYDASVGLRLGYAFAGKGPTLPGAAEFVPFSAELLARYWLGRDPFARPGPRAYLMIGVGAAEFDVAIDVRVREDPTQVHAQGGNDLEQTLRAWKRAGDGFLELGAGFTYPLGPSVAPTLELSACQTFPYAATVVSGNAGIRVGLP